MNNIEMIKSLVKRSVVLKNKFGLTRKKIILEKFYLALNKANLYKSVEIEWFKLFTPKFIGNKSFNWHDDFIKTFESVFKNKKILDICCGRNPIKRIFIKNKKTSITGIDLYEDDADLKIDINKTESYIKPKKQFDVITAFAPMRSSFNSKRFSKYLKDDGLYICGMGKQYFYDKYLPIISGKKNKQSLDIEEELKFFEPIFIVETKGLVVFRIVSFNKKIRFLSGNHFYIFFRKL